MNKKRIIFGSMCVILLIALVGGTLAWFYLNEEVTVNYDNSIFCEAGDSLEIALVENGVVSGWSGSIDYSGKNFTTTDISGNGYLLYRPTEIDENQQPVSLVPAVSSLENSKDYEYVEMEIAFRSTSKMNVYLSEESFINPVNPENTANIYGNFSKDYVAGAMRVAVVDDNGLKMLWAPNSQYELIQNANGSYSFNSGENGNSTPESAYYFYAEDENGNLVQQKVSSDAYADKKFVVDSTGANKGYTGKSAALVSLNPRNEGDYDQKTVRIRIWFEGTDREAHQALAGGNINVKLKFVGVSKEINTTMQNAVNAITFDEANSTFGGVYEGMVFSTDGQNWVEYKPESNNLPVLKSGSSIYIKYPETDTYYETDYVKFTKND